MTAIGAWKEPGKIFAAASARPCGCSEPIFGYNNHANAAKNPRKVLTTPRNTWGWLKRFEREPYNTVKAIAPGRFTYVLRKGMISAPDFGAVTTNTSLVSLKIV